VFVNEGQVADVFGPGMYELFTANLPILSTLQAWPHGFESPFKADVYFFSTRRFTDLKWGTKNPVMLRDPEFGPVRLRAFGTYSIRVKDPALFLRRSSAPTALHHGEVTEQVRNLITARFAGAVGTSGIPVLDLAASYEKLGDFITAKIGPEVGGYGLELLQLLVENVSLPPEVEQALDKPDLDGRHRRPRPLRPVPGRRGDARRGAQPGCSRCQPRRDRWRGARPAGRAVGCGPALARPAGPPPGRPSSGPPPLPGSDATTWPPMASRRGRSGRTNSPSRPGAAASRPRPWSGQRGWPSGARRARSRIWPPARGRAAADPAR
jgi:hypothetical protein